MYIYIYYVYIYIYISIINPSKPTFLSQLPYRNWVHLRNSNRQVDIATFLHFFGPHIHPRPLGQSRDWDPGTHDLGHAWLLRAGIPRFRDNPYCVWGHDDVFCWGSEETCWWRCKAWSLADLLPCSNSRLDPGCIPKVHSGTQLSVWLLTSPLTFR